MASQAMQASDEARDNATTFRRGGLTSKADRWDRVAHAFADVAEAFTRASAELDAVSTER